MTDSINPTPPNAGQTWWPELLELVDCLETEAARSGGRPTRALADVCTEIEKRLDLLRE